MEMIRVLLLARDIAPRVPLPGLALPKDDADSPSVVHRLLEDSHYHVTRAFVVEDAMEALRTTPFDLLLLDHEPTFNASACPLLERLVNDEKLCHIPSVVMSTVSHQETVAQCLHFGAVDYLVKPLRKNELNNLWVHVWRRKKLLMQGYPGPSKDNSPPNSQPVPFKSAKTKAHTSANFPNSGGQCNDSNSSPNSSSEDEDSGTGSNCENNVRDNQVQPPGAQAGPSAPPQQPAAQTPQQQVGGAPPAVANPHVVPAAAPVVAQAAAPSPAQSAFKVYKTVPHPLPTSKRARSAEDNTGATGAGGGAGAGHALEDLVAGPLGGGAHTAHTPYAPHLALPGRHFPAPSSQGQPSPAGPSAAKPGTVQAAQETLLHMLAQARPAAGAEPTLGAAAALSASTLAHLPHLEHPLAHHNQLMSQMLHISQGLTTSAGLPVSLLAAQQMHAPPTPPPPPPAAATAVPAPAHAAGANHQFSPAGPQFTPSSPNPQLAAFGGPFPFGLAMLQDPTAVQAVILQVYGQFGLQPGMPGFNEAVSAVLASIQHASAGSTSAASPQSTLHTSPHFTQPSPASAAAISSAPPLVGHRALGGAPPLKAARLGAPPNTASLAPAPAPLMAGSLGPMPAAPHAHLVGGGSTGSLGAAPSGGKLRIAKMGADGKPSGSEGPVLDPAAEAAAIKTERRQEALRKFQVKKQFRSFEKKILYDSRKQLAEQRPRIQGKFMRIDKSKSTSTTPSGSGADTKSDACADTQGSGEARGGGGSGSSSGGSGSGSGLERRGSDFTSGGGTGGSGESCTTSQPEKGTDPAAANPGA